MKTTFPLSFLLGFFVSGVVGRWWQMYMGIPWLNRVTFLSDGIIIGKSPPESRKIKTTLMRYLILSWILLMRKISKQIESRFSLKDNQRRDKVSVRNMLMNFNGDKKIQNTFRKIITESEVRAFESIAAQNFVRTDTKYIPEYWIPLQWASRLLQKALMNGFIVDIRTTVKLIDELDKLRGQMQNLRLLCSIMIPLVYTQVVIIAVYSYFLCQLFASQFQVENSDNKIANTSLGPSKRIGHEIDFIFYPLFTVFQFLFIMGWLKVAICLLNPFGNGEEDFQTSDILDQNLDVCWRSGCAHDDNYPDLLSPPLFHFKVTAPSNDSLNSFISLTEEEIAEFEPSIDDKNIVSIDWSMQGFNRLNKMFCCHHDDSQDSWTNNIESPNSQSLRDDMIFAFTSQRSLEKQKSFLSRERLSVVKEESPFPSLPTLNSTQE